MPKLLSGFIAKQIAKKLGPQLKPATLVKVTPGTRTTASGGLHPTSANYAARGFVESYSEQDIDGTIITRQDRKVSLLGQSITGGQVPSSSDLILIEGITYTILNVPGRDPDAAIYECQCRA